MGDAELTYWLWDMRPKIIALADCNSFFVSCEVVFNPALAGTPVVVLSGNDACVISRSPEAKAIGIKMQAMGSEVKRYVDSHGLAIFSTNPPLYRDLSRRVMQTLAIFVPRWKSTRSMKPFSI